MSEAIQHSVKEKVGHKYFLCGQYEHTVDAKGRMNFPAKLREKLPACLKIGKALGAKCITVYTEDSWEKICSYVEDLPPEEAAEKSRDLFGFVFDVELDKTGRMPLPPLLRKMTGISENVVVVGAGTTAEIWDSDTWYARFEAPSEK